METRLERHARNGRPLGDEKFLKHAERITGRHLKAEKTGPKPQEKRRNRGRRKIRK